MSGDYRLGAPVGRSCFKDIVVRHGQYELFEMTKQEEQIMDRN